MVRSSVFVAQVCGVRTRATELGGLCQLIVTPLQCDQEAV